MKRKYIEPADQGVRDSNEHNDCAVRALSNAAGCSYDAAHSKLRQYGRRNRSSSYFHQMIPAYKDYAFELTDVYGRSNAALMLSDKYKQVMQNKGCTLGTFLKSCNDKEYIVIITGHAVAVRNKEVIDIQVIPANKRVQAVFTKVKE